MTDHPAKSDRALLVVDVQNDFTESGDLPVAGGAAVAAAVTEALRDHDYALVVASRDWHEPDSDNQGHFADWPVHCVAGTPGAEYHPAFDTSRVDVHVRKGMGVPAYSAFEGETDSGASLDDALRAHGIRRLDVCGLATDYCVRESALSAAWLGYAVRVLLPLSAGVAPETTAAAIEELTAAGIEVVR